VANVLFIDNPVGTGYSYVTHDSAYTKDVHQIAQDLMTTITAFLQQLPDFQVEASMIHYNDFVSSVLLIMETVDQLYTVRLYTIISRKLHSYNPQ